MPGITGMGTTFNLPNYVGELFAASPEDTPFLSAIGGLTGGRPAQSTIFTWSGYDLRDASATRQRLEGADAPTAEARARFNVSNVCEIHQEAVTVSYTKQAAVGQYASTGSNNTNAVGIGGSNAVDDEADWQLQQSLKQIARDIELSFITGTFAEGADNTTARKTRGLLAAIATNVITNSTAADLTSDMVLTLMQDVWSSGGIMEQETATLVCGPVVKRNLSTLFVTNRRYMEQTRNVGGVNLTTIETDFGRLNIMLNRYMPLDELAVVSLEECAPRFLPVPGKGFLFQEPLAKTGSADKYQLYGEVGLEYGNEKKHGKITGLTTNLVAANDGS